jgi:serine protease Do
VIGVNAVIASESGGFEGIGFAIPSNMAQHIARVLIAHGKVERGWLGVSIQDLTPELAQSVHLETSKGAYVVEVVKGGPAERGGLQKGDVVVGYEGKEVTDAGALRNQVAVTPIGEEARLMVWREGKKLELMVKIGRLEDATRILASAIKERLGITARPLNPKEVEKYGLDANQGVAIATVEPKGPLGEAGFEVGDIILGIDNQPVEGMEGFVSMVSSLKPKQKITLLAVDHGSGNTGTIQVEVR